MQLYRAKVYDNGALVRDFIPAKNASGVIGLWDDVGSAFYENAGTGVFTAGAEVSGTHKTLIGGTEYEVTGGYAMVDGTVYRLSKGRTLVDGTAYEISFAPEEPTVTYTVNIHCSSMSCWISVLGTTYNTPATETLTVPEGSVLTAYATGCVYLNDVAQGMQYSHTVMSDLDIFNQYVPQDKVINLYINET